MEQFYSISPSLLLTPYVKEYWFLSTDSAYQEKQRAIPSGYTGLIFNCGDGNIYSEEYGAFPKSYLFGQSVKPIDMHFNGLNLFIVVFQPLAVRFMFGIPTYELKGEKVELDLLGISFKELEKRLLGISDKRETVKQIEVFLLNLLHRGEDHNYRRLLPVHSTFIRSGSVPAHFKPLVIRRFAISSI